MSLNCNEINLILAELDLEGSFIQEIIQPGYDTLALYTYKNGSGKTVVICTAPNACRINETVRKIPKNDKPLRFMEFLKSKIRGAKIVKAEQINLERILRFELTHENEKFIMYARLWSNAGNIILCDENNCILDTMFRRPQKNEITGGTFVIPEIIPNDKIWPIRDFKEIEKSYKENHPEIDTISFNKKVDIWYSEHAVTLSREALLEQALKWYTQRKSKQVAALEKLKAKQKAFSLSAQKKHQGDLILSYAHLLDGSSNFLECTDYESGATVRIKIDKAKSAHENAALYYDEYKKEASGFEQLKDEIKMSEAKLKALDDAYNKMLNEKNPVRIEQLLRKDSKPKQQEKKKHPGLDYTVDGWYILVGRDANENDELLRHHVRGSDMWLHVRDFSGGYVFIKYRAGKTIPLEILLDAGNLAVHYSKARVQGKADLYYTQVKYLRRAKNGPKGLVLPTHEKNLHIQIDDKRITRLDRIRQESQLL